MNSPYLDQPLVPLVVALPQMAEQIQAELVGNKLAAADQRHLRQRVELIRQLLTPPDNLARPSSRLGSWRGSRSSGFGGGGSQL